MTQQPDWEVRWRQELAQREHQQHSEAMDRQAHSGRHGIVGLLLFGMFIASYRLRKVLGVIAFVVLIGSGLGYVVAAAIGNHDVRAWAVLGVFFGAVLGVAWGVVWILGWLLNLVVSDVHKDYLRRHEGLDFD
jgi:hypothetical protein